MSIYQQPVGASCDAPFTVTDMADLHTEFPQAPFMYFGNDNQTIICIANPLNPAIQWCSPKAEAWTPSFGWNFPHFPPLSDSFGGPNLDSPPPPGGGPPGTLQPTPGPGPGPDAPTPEPAQIGLFIVAAFLLIVIAIRRCGARTRACRVHTRVIAS